MAILSAQTVRKLAKISNLIEPFEERSVFNGFSYGLSSCGYDIRVREDFKIKNGDFVLASTIEKFNLPNHLCMRILDKSSWARLGLLCQNTIAEPGWIGYLTLEITYHGNDMLSIISGTPIAQVVFEELDFPTEQPYKGKYQNQLPIAIKTIKEI